MDYLMVMIATGKIVARAETERACIEKVIGIRLQRDTYTIRVFIDGNLQPISYKLGFNDSEVYSDVMRGLRLDQMGYELYQRMS